MKKQKLCGSPFKRDLSNDTKQDPPNFSLDNVFKQIKICFSSFKKRGLFKNANFCETNLTFKRKYQAILNTWIRIRIPNSDPVL